MKLSPQKKYLIDLYKDGGWKFSTAIQFVRDFRKRFSELRTQGYDIQSMVCDKRCGVNHTANIHMYRIADVPKKQIYIYDLNSEGVRVPRAVTVNAV